MGLKIKCSICGKEYDNYKRTFYIQYSTDKDKKCCCLSCMNKNAKLKPYRFRNYVPNYYKGEDVITSLFDTKNDLIVWLNKEYGKNGEKILCCDDTGDIITVDTEKPFWWVVGCSNLKQVDLPNWKETVVKYHGNIFKI